jgi:hypothetical protein
MHSQEEVDRALSLVRDGLNDCEISRRTGINRKTILDWRHGRVPKRSRGWQCWLCRGTEILVPTAQYAYLLGQYLGDGFIARSKKGVFALRVYSFSEYPNIIAECAAAMRAMIPVSKVSIYPVAGVRLVIIQSHSKHWPCLFPQHGNGRKHER